MWNIFEYPFTAIALTVLSMITVWLYRIFQPAKRKRRQLLIPPAVAAVLIGLMFLVQTDREKIIRVIGTGITAFESRQIEPIRQIISDDYADGAHNSKEMVVAYCQALFETMAVEDVTTIKKQTEVENDKANFTTEVLVKFAEESKISQMGKPFMIVKAIFYLKKNQPSKWLIYGCDILELDRKPVSWDQLRGP